MTRRKDHPTTIPAASLNSIGRGHEKNTLPAASASFVLLAYPIAKAIFRRKEKITPGRGDGEGKK